MSGKTVTLITVFQGRGENYYKGLTKCYWRERERIGGQSQVKFARESGIRGGPREMLNSYEGWGRCSQRWGKANGKPRGNYAVEIIDRQSTDTMKYLEMPQTNIFRWKNTYAQKEPSSLKLKRHTNLESFCCPERQQSMVSLVATKWECKNCRKVKITSCFKEIHKITQKYTQNFVKTSCQNHLKD